jgi:hypothetical protein
VKTVDQPWLREPVPEIVEIISVKRTAELTSLSPRQQDRLEQAGLFPASIHLGPPGKRTRKGRALHEVVAWNRYRLSERDGRIARQAGGASAVIGNLPK